MTKSTMQLLENNRKTHKALKQGSQKNKVDLMDEDDNEEKTIKEILEEILTSETWDGRRASKLDQDDFLQLLSEFNEAGIHFC